MCNHDNTHVQQCTFRDVLNLMSKNQTGLNDNPLTIHVMCIAFTCTV